MEENFYGVVVNYEACSSGKTFKEDFVIHGYGPPVSVKKTLKKYYEIIQKQQKTIEELKKTTEGLQKRLDYLECLPGGIVCQEGWKLVEESVGVTPTPPLSELRSSIGRSTEKDKVFL